jgi:hypothetical protein
MFDKTKNIKNSLRKYIGKSSNVEKLVSTAVRLLQMLSQLMPCDVPVDTDIVFVAVQNVCVIMCKSQLSKATCRQEPT